MSITIFLLLGGGLGLAVGIAFTAVFFLARSGEGGKPDQSELGAQAEPPILKVWSGEDGELLWIELGAKRYIHAKNLDSVQRARLEKVLQHLLDWMGIRASAGVPASTRAGVEGLPAGPVNAGQMPVGEVYPADQDPAEKPKLKPLDILARGLARRIARSPDRSGQHCSPGG